MLLEWYSDQTDKWVGFLSVTYYYFTPNSPIEEAPTHIMENVPASIGHPASNNTLNGNHNTSSAELQPSGISGYVQQTGPTIVRFGHFVIEGFTFSTSKYDRLYCHRKRYVKACPYFVHNLWAEENGFILKN